MKTVKRFWVLFNKIKMFVLYSELPQNLDDDDDDEMMMMIT